LRKKLFLFDCSYLFRYSIFFIVSLLSFSLRAQEVDTTIDNSAILIRIDSLTSIQPSQNGDSSKLDSVKLSPISAKKASPNAITNSVTYNAVDSIRMDIKRRKAYLYKNAVVYYEDMELQADYIEIDFSNNELYASGISDDEGIITGHPVFKQGGASYRAHEMRYNFTTKKGKITDVITTEGEGYIHGEQVKKLQDNTTFIKKGKYTTCELEQPHFDIAFSKAKCYLMIKSLQDRHGSVLMESPQF
jgi:lipopolysaccharide assembly outer membrane protein LptD (OstA)